MIYKFIITIIYKLIMEFGIIFHWGLYSVPAFDNPESILKRKIQNGSEWYQKRLEEKGTYRPVYKETQEYHKLKFKDKDYKDFINIDNCKFDNWMKLCKEVNATYVILTAKHHDGFCLWPTKSTNFCVKKDLVKEFIESAKKYNLKYGIYYSWYEFNRTCTKNIWMKL